MMPLCDSSKGVFQLTERVLESNDDSEMLVGGADGTERRGEERRERREEQGRVNMSLHTP